MAQHQKISLLLSSLAGGGAEKISLNLAKHLLNKNYEVDIVLSEFSGELADDVPEEASVVNLGASRELASTIPLIRYLRNESPDVMVSTGTGMNIISCLSKIVAMDNTKRIIRIQNTMSQITGQLSRPEHRAIPWLIKLLFPIADEIVAVSEGVARDLINISSISRDEITIIYNPTHVSKIQDLSYNQPSYIASTENSSTIISVGSLTKQKDYDTLLNAFKIVSEKIDIDLVILGEGPMRSDLQQLTEEFTIEDNVIFPGFVDNPYPEIKNADALVLSSKWEGLPNVLIEALACGTSVVSTNCPHGPEEILGGGEYGLLVPPEDPESLAHSIVHAVHNPVPAVKLRSRASDFEANKLLDEYLTLIYNCR